MAAAATAVHHMPTDAADRRDIEATLNGHSEAYARLVARHQPRIAAHMWRFTRDRLVYEELVHDVFVEAYLNLRSYRGDAPLEHWLMKIATRVGYRHWKEQSRRRARNELSLANYDAAAPDSSQSEQNEAAEQVHRVLGQLPPRDRLVLTLVYLEGCTIDEAARLAGWSHTMTKVQAFRARAKLKKLLTEEESSKAGEYDR
jgi:RNA polymerase sigma-70 factor (ECF subfamily)